MLVIRLMRTGKRNAPSYRVVLIKKTAPPQSGKFLEILGNYNPRSKEISLNKERIEYWLSQGVQTSDTVHNILVNQGIIKGPKIKKKIRIKKKSVEGAAASGKKTEAGISKEKTEVTTSKEAPTKEAPVEKENKEDKPKQEQEEPVKEKKKDLDKTNKKK